MARIRSIKPEFPQSETIGKLSRDARLLFIQIWTIVDDEGRARAASRMLASLLFPYDDDAPGLIEGWLGELEQAGCVRRYDVEGASYLDLPNWLKHQKIDKPSGSRIPAFVEGSEKPRECSRSLAPDLGPRTLDQGPRIEDTKADALDAKAASAPPPVSVSDIPEATSFVTPTDRLWGEGLPELVALGAPERQCRSMIGKWLRDTHDPAGVLTAIRAARDAGSGDPIPFVTRVLNPTTSRTGNRYEPETAVAALARHIDRAERGEFGANVFGDRPTLLTAHVRGRG